MFNQITLQCLEDEQLNHFIQNLEICKKSPSCIVGKYKNSQNQFSQVFTDKDLKKPLFHPVSCKCAYCNSEPCMKLRKREAHLLLKSYFEHAKDKGKNVSHAVVGFPRVSKKDITPKYVKFMRSKIRKIKKELIRKDNLLKVIGVMDLSYKPQDDTFYFHWHLALFFPSWHRGNLRYKELRDITLKENMIFTRFHEKTQQGKLFKNPVRVLDYLAKRFAGILEHPTQDDKDYSKYSDFFTPQEYFKVFYREKRLFTWGYSKEERQYLKQKYARAFLCSIIGNNEHYYVAEIGQIQKYDIIFLIEPLKNFNKPSKEPPPDPENLNIEYIKIL